MSIADNVRSPRAFVTTIVGPALITTALVLPTVLLSSRLPDPMAIHWGVGGQPNGHGPWWVPVLLLTVLWCVAWVALLSIPPTHRREVAAGVYSIGVLLVGVQTVSVFANLDKTSWTRAHDFPNLLVVLVFTLAVLVIGAAIGWAISGPDALPEPGTADARVRPSAGLQPGERVVWTGAAHNRGMYVLAAVLIVPALAFGRVPLFIVGVIAVAVALWCSRVHVVVGPAGITTAIGVLAWPRRLISYDECSGADVVNVVPLAYGGWGWRIRPHRTAVVVRKGDAIDLELRNGNHFVVTVDGAEQAAGVVNDYIAGQPPRAA
jgi:hypothetical protein